MSEPGNTVQGIGGPGGAAHQCGKKGWYSRGYLPHLDSSHVIQHITYRLADSLPLTVLEQMRADVAATVADDEQRKNRLRHRIEDYLDAGHGSCVLKVPGVAACIENTWHHFDGKRYRLLEWVVMPNHCHVLIEPFEDEKMGKIVLSWKNYTARFINEYKSRSGELRVQKSRTGVRRPRVWQREYWDRYIRDERHFEAVKRYIMNNPVNAGLAATPEEWPWGSARFKAANHSDGKK